MRRLTAWCIVLGLLICGIVFAEDAAKAVIVPLQSGDTSIPQWLSIALDTLGAILAAVGSWFILWLKSKAQDNATEQEVIECLRTGVATTYNTLYQDYKNKTEDGTLTVLEKTALRQNAIDQAKKFASGPALKMLEDWGVEYLHGVVQRIVLQQKSVVKNPVI